MGFAVGWLAQAITATFGVGANIANAAAQIIVGVGVSVASNALFRPRSPNMPRQEFRSTLNQASGERLRGYGRMKLAGTRAFWNSKDGILYQVIVFHHGQVHAIDRFFVGDDEVTLDGAGWVKEEPYRDGDDTFIRMATRVGTPGQTAFEEMAVWGQAWDERYRLRGLACLYVEFVAPELERYSEVFPEGPNTTIRIEARMSRVYDPRTGTTGYSENPALAIRDYLTHPDGYRLSADQIDDASFAAFANICDQIVPLKSGGGEARYRLGGVYSLQDDPKDVLARLMATCDGDVHLTADGKVAIRGGVWRAPTVQLGPDDILAFDMQEGANKFSAFNVLQILYCEPGQDYQLIEAPRWQNAEDIAVRGEVPEELRLDMVQSPAQAQRLAKIHQHRQNPRWRGTIRTKAIGLNARGEATIRVTLPELAIDEVFRVDDHGIVLDGGVFVGCEIAISSLPAEAYDWNPQTEEGVPDPVDPIEVSRAIEVPTGLDPEIELRSIGVSTTAPVIVLTVATPVRKGLVLEAEYRLKPSGPWEGMSTGQGNVATSSVVIDGEDYQVRARWLTASNTASRWSAVAEISV